jgi:hypothetical protein
MGSYAVLAYVLACGLQAGGRVTVPVAFLMACGIVVYIVALGGLMVAHFSESRPSWELVLPLLFPFVLYQSLWGSFRIMDKDLWIFVGLFTFLQVTGGFVLGILVAPLVAAMTRPSERGGIRARVLLGIRAIRTRRLQVFGIVLSAGLLGALVHALSRMLLAGLPRAQASDVWSVSIALAAGVLLVAGFSQRHTVFR